MAWVLYAMDVALTAACTICRLLRTRELGGVRTVLCVSRTRSASAGVQIALMTLAVRSARSGGELVVSPASLNYLKLPDSEHQLASEARVTANSRHAFHSEQKKNEKAHQCVARSIVPYLTSSVTARQHRRYCAAPGSKSDAHRRQQPI